jgi:hypothetical protein
MRMIPIWRRVGGNNWHPDSLKQEKIAEAKVSDEDYPYASQFRYGLDRRGYVSRFEHKDGRTIAIRLHNEIAARMGLILKPGETVDHQDRVKLNCQRGNFRAASNILQRINQGTNRNSTSGVPGVSWNKKDNRWAAHACLGGVKVSKEFRTKEEAIHARKVMELERQQVMEIMKEGD